MSSFQEIASFILSQVQAAVAHKDIKGARNLIDLFDFATRVEELRIAFLSCGYRIDGKRGTAKRLGVSKNAVYVRLQSLGLTRDSFCEPDIPLSRLLLISKKKREFKRLLQVGSKR